jgi:predicted Zn-dependent protease
MYYGENNIKQSIAMLKKGVDANPHDIKLGLSLASYYERDGDYADAANVYENILENNPENILAINNLAALLSEYKQDQASLARAKDLADKIKNVDQPVIKDTVGWVYYKAGDYNDALEMLKQVVTAMPDVEVFNYHLGMAYYKSGDKANARQHLEKSVSGKEKYPGIEEARATLKSL